jgi:hypothetical protein
MDAIKDNKRLKRNKIDALIKTITILLKEQSACPGPKQSEIAQYYPQSGRVWANPVIKGIASRTVQFVLAMSRVRVPPMRTPVIDHFLLFVVILILLCFLSKFRDSYPLNYGILFVWLLALIASIPSACFVVLFKSDVSFPISFEEYFGQQFHILKSLQILRKIWLDFCWNCESLTKFRHQIFRAGMVSIVTSALIISLTNYVGMLIHRLEPALVTVCTTMSCCWLYILLTGMRFGGFSISERQHR